MTASRAWRSFLTSTNGGNLEWAAYEAEARRSAPKGAASELSNHSVLAARTPSVPCEGERRKEFPAYDPVKNPVTTARLPLGTTTMQVMIAFSAVFGPQMDALARVGHDRPQAGVLLEGR